MKRYKVEMTHGQDQRLVEADSVRQIDDWLIFYRLPPQGGPALEHWRVRIECVVSMETVR